MPERTTPAAEPSPNPNFMLSLARGLSVIRALGESQGRQTAAELARHTGLSRAAVRRCLYTLCELGYATASRGTYDLTPAVLALGYAYISSTALTRAAQPVLERVANELHESSSMAQLDGYEIVYVARVAMQRILSIGLSVGSRLPAACTSMGRVLIASLAEPEIARFVSKVPLVAYTPRTIVGRSELRAELARVKAEGYALVDQEFELGLRSIAVPVHGPDETVVAAINVGVQVTRATTKTLQRDFLPVLRRAATDIRAVLRAGGAGVTAGRK
jgi:IclR family pca regulon transcriptional regulator